MSPLKKQQKLSFQISFLTLVALASMPAASQDLEATCALPFVRGLKGNDCNGVHSLEYEVRGGSPSTTVNAQLLALDENGTLLHSLPVTNHDSAQLKSRLEPKSYRWRTTAQGVHQVSAPLPVLEIIAVDGDEEARAYCSNVPYMGLEQPTGAVVIQGNPADVTIAIPRVDVSTLSVLVDGVDVLSQLGLNPATDFPGGPYGGTVDINGATVEITDLIVSAGDIDTLASNTLTMSLSSLPAGGHVILADAEPAEGALADNPSAECLVDDVRDAGQFSVFGVDIFTPGDQEIATLVPTPVEGEARHGLPITGLKINGASKDTSAIQFTPGNGETTADQYVLPFNENLDETDLAADLASGSEPLGTLDRGSNKLIVDALDGLGNRAFADRRIAVGEVASPSTPPQLGDTLRATRFAAILERRIQPIISGALDATTEDIENSFVLGLTGEALQTLIDQKCVDASKVFKDSVEAKIAELQPSSKKINGGCSCSPNVETGIRSVSIDVSQATCPIDLQDGKIAVTVNLPDVIVYGYAEGDCKTEEAGVCIARTRVDIDSTTTITGIHFSYDITEDQFFGGPLSQGVMITGTSTLEKSGGVNVSCLADVCEFAVDAIDDILNFLGADSNLDLTPTIDMTQVSDFNKAIGASEPDPVDLGEIDVSEEEVEQFGQASLSGNLANVEITPRGLRATLSGAFKTLALDPEVEPTPGAVVEIAPPPTVPFTGADDATVLISDEVLNQLFTSMTQSGGLKTSCNDTGKTVADVLPADCDALSGVVASATCHAIAGDDCDTLVGADSIQTATKQGACHGTKGDVCTLISTDGGTLGQIEINACQQATAANLSASDPVLVCARQDNPPRFLIQDDPATANEVETAVRLPDLSIAIVVDRGGDGVPSNDLAAIAPCIGSSATSVEDCSLNSVCLDLNLITASSLADLASCPGGEPGILTRIVEFQPLIRQEGAVCGATQETTDTDLVATSNDDPTVDLIGNNLDRFTPPLCLDGLTLGGFVEFSNPRLIAIETDGNTEFQDYIGITGAVAPPSP